MLPNEVKENMIVGIIMASHVESDTKTELIKYVRSHNSAAIQASFSLGQMDMKESVMACLLDESKVCHGVISSTLRAAADYFKEMEVI